MSQSKTNDLKRSIYLTQDSDEVLVAWLSDNLSDNLRNFTNRTDPPKVLWIDDFHPVEPIKLAMELPFCDANTISKKEINRYLGRETQALIYDARDELNVNALCAAAGTLVGGGILVVRMPDNFCLHAFTPAFESVTEQTDSFALLDKLKLIATPNTQWPRDNFLLTHFVASLMSKNLSSGDKPPVTVLPRPNSIYFKADNDSCTEQTNETSSSLKKVAIAIEKSASGHAKRPLIITAKRGRGKSTALALGCKKIINNSDKTVVITAPNKKHLDVFFRQLTEKAGAKASTKIAFRPIDKLIEKPIVNGIIIVDEAGAIPVHQLRAICDSYNRVVFATTTDGYEGNGKGFELRFEPFIKQTYRQYKKIELTIPLRWHNSDLLEQAVDDTFFPDQSTNLATFERTTNKNESTRLQNIEPKETTHLSFFSEQKINAFSIIKKSYRLLVEAHYQTRPSDFERILQDDKISVHLSIIDHQVVSICLITEEGLLSPSDCEEIEAGEKRLSGQLLAQSLMANSGVPHFGTLKTWRVMRIATQQTMRNQGLAKNLLNYVIEKALSQSVDLIGTSFALTPGLEHFWLINEFKCVRISNRKDSSTGLATSEFIRPLSTKAEKVSLSAIYRFEKRLFYKLAGDWKSLPTDFVLQLLTKQLSLSQRKNKRLKRLEQMDSDYFKKECERYIDGARGFKMVDDAIYYLLKENLNCLLKNDFEDIEKSLAIALVFQRTPFEEAINKFQLKGKKQMDVILKKFVSRLVTYSCQA